MTTSPARVERFTDETVNYTIEIDGRVVIVESVPARVDVETGERFFSPETLERLQGIVWGENEPDRLAETPVFKFAA
jgi:hypothetical protein